jgi:hypothetical protein
VGITKSSRTITVSETSTAAALLSPPLRGSLLPFLGRELTISQAAAETGTKLNTMYARVKKLLGLELLLVGREQPRNGRAIKLYRSTSDRYFLPYRVVPDDTRLALEEQLDSHWERELRKAIVQAREEALGDWGFEVYRGERGTLQLHPASEPGMLISSSDPAHPAVINLWEEEISLDFHDAKALQRALYEVVKAYKGRSGAQPYLLRIGMAPLKAH